MKNYLGLIRFSHTVFALPFSALACVWAFVYPTESSWDSISIGKRLLGILVCMVAARSAAMAFNRLVDAKYDAANPRTAQRHIPAGLLSRGQVILFFVVCCLIFVVATLLFLPNRWPLYLAIPVLLWLCGYSLAKRFTAAAHMWLGVALAMSPICTWIALRGEELAKSPLQLIAPALLATAIACWVSGFDIIYACQDADYDRGAKLHSIPARLGVTSALRLAAGLHLVMWLVLATIPFLQPELRLGTLFYVALVIVAVLLFRQHRIVIPNDLSRVNEAFFNLNAVISLGFTGLAAIDSCIESFF
ncbi:MAG: UbiA-like polyprenyltransferase [Pirellulales bacterium]